MVFSDRPACSSAVGETKPSRDSLRLPFEVGARLVALRLHLERLGLRPGELRLGGADARLQLARGARVERVQARSA